MSEQFIVEQLEILNDENDFKGEYWWAVINTERIEDTFECRNKEVAIKLCAFLNKATDDFKWQIRQSEKWSAKVKQLKEENEQQATIEHLTKSRDKWSKSAKLHSEYFNCLEKAIEIAYEEKPYPKIEDIMTIYSKLEKEIDDE